MTIQVLVLFHLDGGNALLYGTPETTLAPLKGILHTASWLIKRLNKSNHITVT